MLPKLHFPKNAFTLELFFQRAERLINIVIAYLYLQEYSPPFKCAFRYSQEGSI